MKKYLQILGISIFAILSFSSYATVPVRAACEAADRSVFELIPTWYKYLDLDPATCEFNSFSIPGDIWKIALAGVEIILRIAGLVATGFVIFAGFKYVLSRGNPAEAAKARQTIIDAVIGVAISSIATVLVAFLGRILTREV